MVGRSQAGVSQQCEVLSGFTELNHRLRCVVLVGEESWRRCSVRAYEPDRMMAFGRSEEHQAWCSSM